MLGISAYENNERCLVLTFLGLASEILLNQKLNEGQSVVLLSVEVLAFFFNQFDGASTTNLGNYLALETVFNIFSFLNMLNPQNCIDRLYYVSSGCCSKYLCINQVLLQNYNKFIQKQKVTGNNQLYLKFFVNEFIPHQEIQNLLQLMGNQCFRNQQPSKVQPLRKQQQHKAYNSRNYQVSNPNHYLISSVKKEVKTNEQSILKKDLIILNDGVTYEGEWKSKMKHGYGVQIWKDGAKYEGNWENDQANGKGTFKYINGDQFVGQWKHNKANGFGTYYGSQMKYEGFWKDQQMNGIGKQIWKDGCIFQGNYLKGMKHGEGKITWADNNEYQGNWQNNEFSGMGIYKWPDGTKYQGQWKNNMMNGKGKLKSSDGRIYQGNYKDNKKNGFGVLIQEDGRKYEGLWLNGKKNGKGKLYTPSGDWREGIWLEGKRQQWLQAPHSKQC